MVTFNLKPVAERGYASQSSIISKVTQSLNSLSVYTRDVENSPSDLPMGDVAELVESFEGGEVSFLDAIRRSRVFHQYNGETSEDHALRREQFWEKVGSYNDVAPSEMHLEAANNLEHLSGLCQNRIAAIGAHDEISGKAAGETLILEKSSDYFKAVADILKDPDVHSAAYDAVRQKGEAVREVYASEPQELVLRPGMEFKQ